VPRATCWLVFGLAIAAAPCVATAQVTPGAASPRPVLLPGTRPDVLTTIQGNALDSTNGPMPNVVVRLRDARLGRIVDTATTDPTGLFTFHAVDPGSYIVEMLGEDGTVLASSQLLNVDAGEVISAIVKLPFRLPPFGGLLGHSLPAAAAVVAAAATSGVLATSVAGESQSP
jgi:hypothetical protein